MHKRQGGYIGAILAVFAFFLLLVGPFIFNLFYVYGTQEDRTITVNKTERVQSSSGNDSKYLVYAKEGVFENTDSILRWKFNSADVYNSVLPNQTYTCDTYGWRIPFFSMYPNIVSCEQKK